MSKYSELLNLIQEVTNFDSFMANEMEPITGLEESIAPILEYLQFISFLSNQAKHSHDFQSLLEEYMDTKPEPSEFCKIHNIHWEPTYQLK